MSCRIVSMSGAEMSLHVRALLERLAEAVTDRTNSAQWHVEQGPASATHRREAMLIFTSPLDPTVEEVVVTVSFHDAADAWSLDVIDREGLPLVQPAGWHPGDSRDGPASLVVLSQTVASLEDRIVGTLHDLRPGS
jgi:hypothetical protein